MRLLHPYKYILFLKEGRQSVFGNIKYDPWVFEGACTMVTACESQNTEFTCDFQYLDPVMLGVYL